jgi:hypothetical protein
MKKLPKIIQAHSPVAYFFKREIQYGQHTPGCQRGKSRLQVVSGYDHEAGTFTHRWVPVQNVISIGDHAVKPTARMTDCDASASWEEVAEAVRRVVPTDREKTTEAIKKKYRHNFQKRDEVQHDLALDREINIKLDKRAMRRWLKESEKSRNNSPLPPVDTQMPKRIVRKLARKKYHGSMTLKALVKSGAIKL